MFRKTKIKIDLKALENNLRVLKGWTGRGFFCPMVKANAYGHGDLLVASAVERFSGIDALGVALIEEGVRLREGGIRTPVLVFAPFDVEGARAMIEHRLTPVAGRLEDLVALSDVVSANQKLDLHLKFNTGMQRLGFDPPEMAQVKSFLQTHRNFHVTGLCTHLAHGEEAADPHGVTQSQIRRFREMSEGFPGQPHVHKSSSLAVLKEEVSVQGLGSRPGIALYGLAHEGTQTADGVRPVLSWQSELVRLHTVESGTPVGYGSGYRPSRRSIIGVVPVGYGDGYSRLLWGKANMLYRGRRVPVVGRVCMDYTFVDLTDAIKEGAAQAGEPIVILGAQGTERIRAEELAEAIGTISYEVVTAISTRVPREAL